jgi:hypothetical protein
MRKQKIITFRVSEEEYQRIVKLAQLLERNKSDSIRFVLLKAVQKLGQDPGWLKLYKPVRG